MLFLVLPKARDADGLYVMHTMLNIDGNVTWKQSVKRIGYDTMGLTKRGNPGRTHTKHGIRKG